MINEKSICVRSSTVTFYELDNEIVLYNDRENELLGLNSAASDLWALLSQPFSLNEIGGVTQYKSKILLNFLNELYYEGVVDILSEIDNASIRRLKLCALDNYIGDVRPKILMRKKAFPSNAPLKLHL